MSTVVEDSVSRGDRPSMMHSSFPGARWGFWLPSQHRARAWETSTAPAYQDHTMRPHVAVLLYHSGRKHTMTLSVASLCSPPACRPDTVAGGTDDPQELGHGRLPAANSNGTLELQDVRSCCNASLALNLCRH